MSKADRAHRRLKLWLPRIWGFTLGGAAVLVGGFLVTQAFTVSASVDPGSDLEFVYPYDL